MSLSLKVPALGESVREATLGVWKHAEGDHVEADEPLVEVESEKATLEVPSPGAGVLTRILRKAGETVAVGEVIAEIDQVGRGGHVAHVDDAGPAAPARDGNGQPAAAPPAAAPAPSLSAVPAAPPPADAGVRAPPSARRALAESGLSPEEVRGTGRGGRISKQDVDRAVEARAQTALGG